jgi:murein DD-endopeptidase MepM/ murein hydrolase activator NlpD
VIIDIGHGHFAFYAHFQPNTLKVHKGDKVRRGQVLALLGNSGNSDAPHLHFGIEDGPLPFASNGLPFVFSSFTTTGTITNPFDDVAAGGTAQIGPARAGLHHNELPLNDDVITFPKQ